MTIKKGGYGSLSISCASSFGRTTCIDQKDDSVVPFHLKIASSNSEETSELTLTTLCYSNLHYS